MKLESIGFYTLSDKRAQGCSVTSPLYRCEMLLTQRCNFKCPYCRGLEGEDLTLDQATSILDYWFSEGLKNVRFSGGEPTLYYYLRKLVRHCKSHGVERIAISTNGSASSELYKELIDAGVNDFSISLDACCASTGDIMTGRRGMWEKVIFNIHQLSELTYVTVGIVLTERNRKEAEQTILLADKLGVSDIRVIPAAQYDEKLNLNIPPKILARHPILQYRLRNKRHVRGLKQQDSHKCALVLDDMAVWQGNHYPCIIYLREGGKPIGKVDTSTRLERHAWYLKHNSYKDTICRNNCLDVCVDYNNKVAKRT